MKKVAIRALVLFGFFTFCAFTSNIDVVHNVNKAAVEEIKWMSWDDAIAAAEKEPKKIFIDVYTDWCGWCKRMDKTTFADPKVVEYVNSNFYAVKFDAEQKGEITFRGHTMKYRPGGRRGVHELAISLLNGRLGYPSYVYLDEQQNRISISPGFKQVDPFLKELTFFAEDHYKTKTFKEYSAAPGK